MIEKEALTLRKIKKDINRNIGILTIRLLTLVLVFCVFCILTINTVKPGTASPLEEIVLIIITVFLGISSVILFVLWLPFTFCAWRKKYKITTEKLTAKEDEPSYSYVCFYKGLGEIGSKYRKECGHFKFYFERSGSYLIWLRKHYRWSARYCMTPRDLFLVSEVGDIFTVVTFNKKIFMIYNNKYFEPTFNLR